MVYRQLLTAQVVLHRFEAEVINKLQVLTGQQLTGRQAVSAWK